MKKRLFILMSVVMAAVACSGGNDDPKTNVKAFSFDGVEYVSLQEAVDVAMPGIELGETQDIIMVADYKGPGAIVNKDYVNYLGIDLSGHKLELISPLDLGNSFAFLSGNGVLSGDILARDAYLSIEGDIDIVGKIILSRTAADNTQWEDNACFGVDFSGSFTGNIELDNAAMSVYSENGVFDIYELNVYGNGGIFNVQTVRNSSVNVQKAFVDDALHICSIEDGALNISSGAQPHVHIFSKSEEKAPTCVTQGVIEYKCLDCGFSKYEKMGENYGNCQAEHLDHVAPLLASSNVGGNVEYWECPFCGRQYQDALGTIPLSGSASLLATNYLGDDYMLHYLDDIFDWQSEFEPQTKDAMAVAGIVLSVIGILETLGLSIPGLVADDGPMWSEVNAKLDMIQASLDKIETKIDALAQKVDAVAYKQLIIERNKQFNFLNTKSVAVFQLISQYIKSNDAGKAEKIESALKDWSANQFGGTNIADLTQSLMQQYVKTGLDANVPKMFEQVANCSYLWEHDGYNFRYQAMAQDVMLTGISYLLAGNYISSVKEYNNEDLREADLRNLKSDFIAYENAVKSELDRIHNRNEKYRRYNPSNITFNIEAKSYNFRNWFSKHRDYGFPRLNQDGKAVASCEAILKDLGLNRDLALTTPIAKEIYNYYNRNNSVKSSIYTILRDSVGFRNIPSRFDPGLIFTNKTSGFDHENDDDAIPVYRMFHWESYRSSNGNDYFGIRTCLHDDCSEGNHNILYKCDISSYSSGHINDLGEETRWNWLTLVKASE